ncbi:hypothetical protein EVAR_60007_1 [Eumeta japonica]|uniref:Uncharacterized protein n=1 Tax=Eumeta variegata TaxID=151549 RepID=A0A4C1ZET0_EUMVA|nr:hypothetical protein EVAR_60007_1 [Eumeta japonica]
MVTVAHEHLKPQRSHRCVVALLEGNGISVEGNRVDERGKGGVDHRNPHALDKNCGWESLLKNVTLGNVTMSHRTRERPPNLLRLSPLNYDRSAANTPR